MALVLPNFVEVLGTLLVLLTILPAAKAASGPNASHAGAIEPGADVQAPPEHFSAAVVVDGRELF